MSKAASSPPGTGTDTDADAPPGPPAAAPAALPPSPAADHPHGASSAPSEDAPVEAAVSTAGHPPLKEGDVHETSPNGQRYVKLDVLLGSGAYKDVWRAYDTREGIEVAWNVIKLKRIPVNDRKRVKNEVLLLKEIEHKNIIKYHSSWMDREKQCVIFITEIMSSGSLKEYLRKNPMVRWKAVKRWCLQILDGLSFLHSKQIIHRDIKCDNIFINGSTGDIRIGDLGLSTRIGLRDGLAVPAAGPPSTDEEDREVTAETMTCLGTPEFMAPELYDETYDVKVDIYAFGMSCLEMITALTPYHLCTSAAQIYKKVSKGELPPELQKVYSRNARAFVTACLQPHDSRPTAEQLLSHEFLKEKEEEDFKFVRGKLGSGGLEELQEEDDEGAHVAPDENYPDGAGPAPSMGIVKSAGNTSSPSRTTISLGSVSVLQEERTVAGGHGNVVINSNESSGNTSVMDSASSGLLFSTADIREGVRHSGNLKSSNETLVGGADGDCNNGRRHSRGGSGDSSGLGRSRILRVQTRAGSASGTDLRPSPVISGPSNPIFNGEVPIINPLIISNSGEEKAAATNDGQLSGEANVPNQLLTTATVFDLLDIENSESGLAKTNESLIFMMSVPGKDLESYKEVGFEFNLLADEPSVLVEEMQTDPDLMDIIEPHASVIVTVLTAVCEVAKRVAVNRIQSNIFDTSLSDAVLIEILKIQAQRDLSYSHFVDCGEGVAIDPLENLCVTARNRKLSSDCNGDLNCYSVSDAEADKLICQDPSYLDLLSSLEENLSRVSKEFDRAKVSFNTQKEKLEENFKRDTEQCVARRSDLNLQLEDMQKKLKARMSEFSHLREQFQGRQREKKIQRRQMVNNNNNDNNSTEALFAQRSPSLSTADNDNIG